MSRPTSVRTEYFYDADGCQNNIDIRIYEKGYFVEINGAAVYEGDYQSCESWLEKYLAI